MLVVFNSIYNLLCADKTAGSLYALLKGQIFSVEIPRQIAQGQLVKIPNPILVYSIIYDPAILYWGKHDIKGLIRFEIHCDKQNGVKEAMVIGDKLFNTTHNAILTFASDFSGGVIQDLTYPTIIPFGNEFIITLTGKLLASGN